MLYGLQTHFTSGGPGEQVCQELANRYFGALRIDAQGISIDLMLERVREVHGVGLHAHVVVSELSQIEALPENTLPIWRNETDHDKFHPMPAEEYAREFMLGCEVAANSPCRILAGPAVSGTHTRGVKYTETVVSECGGALPINAVGIIHRYGHNDRVSSPNRLNRWHLPWGPFKSRDDEYEWFRRTIGHGRPWGIGEVGWATVGGYSEDKQAESMRYEFELAERHEAWFCDWFQINDGPDPNSPHSDDHFGIRRNDGEGNWSWKPAADIPSHLVEERP